MPGLTGSVVIWKLVCGWAMMTYVVCIETYAPDQPSHLNSQPPNIQCNMEALTANLFIDKLSDL